MIDDEILKKVKQKACSETNFVVRLFRKLFTEEEMINKNVSGKKGKEALDPVRIAQIQDCYFRMYPYSIEQERKSKWAKCCEAINTHIRNIKQPN